MQIENKELSKEDIGSKVTYIPNHAGNNALHEDVESGVISSYNRYYVFVEYGRGTAAATLSKFLIWG